MKSGMVTVIMPFFNTGKYVERAVESLIGQSYQNWELIAVDDASRDDSAARIVRIGDPRITLIANAVNLGAGESINSAFPLAQGEYIALMDSDDVMHSDRLTLEVDYLEKYPGRDDDGLRSNGGFPWRWRRALEGTLSPLLCHPQVRRASLQGHKALVQQRVPPAHGHDPQVALG